ncbi:MAG: T9SS type A sorting domain-containing protein, partial [Flavobacteriales bacterium]|nr:T9SS type A sorting domain-containing protein [Flavobacteriales bacterium]
NWEETGLQGWTIPCIDKNVFNTIFAGTESNGLWYSNDFGDSWLPHPDIPTSAKLHEIDVQDNVVAIAAVEGIFLSLDYGISFINTGLAGDINFDMCIHKISPDVELFASTFAGLQYYNTSTATWTLLSDPELDGQLIIGIESNGNEIYAGRFSNSLIIKSTDNGMSWSAIEKSPIATEINDLYVDPENENHLLASMMGSYNIGGTYNKEALRETNDGGLTWNNKGPVAHGLSLTMDPSNSATLYLGTFSSGLFKSTNHFDSHTQLISGNKLIADVAIHPENSEIVIVSQLDLDLISTSILKSTNGGTDFEETAIIGANRLGFNADFPDTVYAGTPDGIHLSDDMGENWSPWLLDGENVLSLHYANNTLYAGTNNGNLYRIVNGTAIEISGSWNTPSELKSIYSINGKLFAGLNGAEKDSTYNLSGSIWMSSDDGDNWTNITTEMTSTNVYGNNIIESNGTNLYLGTYGGGVYRSSDFNLSVESLSSQGIILPYPNPTSDQIILPNVHSISEAFVINQLGQKTQLSHQNFSQHQDGIQINLSELEAGIYYLKVDDLPSMKLIISN